MLRTLMVTEAPSGGTGRHLIDLMEGLRARRCVVALAYSPLRIDPPFREFLARSPWASRCAIPMRRSPHWSDAKARRAIRAFVGREGPFDLIHGHSSKAGLLVRSAGLQRKAAVLYTPHGIYTNNPTNGRASRLVARVLERRLGARCDAVIAVSRDERDHLYALGIPPRRTHYVPNGLRPLVLGDPAEARRRLGLADGRVVGFIGRMAKEKDPVLLIEAFARLASRFPDACLAMVGEGPLRAAGEERVAALDLESRVRWLGFRRASEVMPAFDVLAIPSRSESLPYVLLEAFSAGVPVVACAVGGMKDAVHDLRNGLLVRGRDPREFAEALERVLEDDGLRLYLGAQAARSAQEFTADTMVDRTLALYRELVAERVDATGLPAPSIGAMAADRENA